MNHQQARPAFQGEFWRLRNATGAAGKATILGAYALRGSESGLNALIANPLHLIGLRPSYAAQGSSPLSGCTRNRGGVPHTSTMPHGRPQPSKQRVHFVIQHAKEIGAGTRGATIEPPATSGLVPSQVAARGVGPVEFEGRGT